VEFESALAWLVENNLVVVHQGTRGASYLTLGQGNAA
jgi:hypothetical protein